ncbi:MAG: ATP-binding cassette domain-containing protein [Anaerolineae bacterium]|nr:ATP-binding cassette domain-containing protein [Thermoflexales bacterium]MDW8406839.1 ATP-binding cassette domain-containing protein [Anaerolineae bacterium]
MLKAEQISFRYTHNGPWILRDVSLAIEAGEVVGLSAPSGRGKTTLGKILAGYLPPLTGRVSLNGAPLPKSGYCPVQLIFQHPELAINPRWRMKRVLEEAFVPSAELLRDLGIEAGWLNRWPHELSGGELQRFAVARALGPATRYVIADEMTTMLDANTQAHIWQVVLDHVRRRKLGLLVVSHDAALLGRLCTQIISLPHL